MMSLSFKRCNEMNYEAQEAAKEKPEEEEEKTKAQRDEEAEKKPVIQTKTDWNQERSGNHPISQVADSQTYWNHQRRKV